MLSQAEREWCLDLVFEEGIPNNLRTKFWLKCVGTLSFKIEYCENYYQTLCDLSENPKYKDYPNNHFVQIDKDMGRTFPTEDFVNDEFRASMRRIFRAYVWRNPTVGYI